MQYKSAAIIVAGLAAQRAAATGWSVGANPFSCPGNTNNQCSSSQEGGYDWSGLPSGSFGHYGSNSFSGFTCGNAPNKRDALSKRTFQSKCISGGLDDKPSISCEDNDTFSIDKYHVSSSQDTHIDCEYGMPDGSKCTETHHCSSEGSIIQNSQCGGARSVTFRPHGGDRSGCSLNIHSVGFHCGPPSSTVPATTATPSISTYGWSSSVATTSSESSAETTSASTPVSSSYSASTTSAITSDIVSTYGSSSTSSSAVETSPVTESSSAPVISSYGTSSTSAITSDIASTYGGSTSSSSAVETSPVTESSTTPVISSYGVSTTSAITSDIASTYGGSSSSSVATTPVSSSYESSATSSEASPVTSSSASIVTYSTSTVYSETHSTVTSEGSTVVVTSTIAISTTICPVTATETGSAPAGYTPSSSVVSPVQNVTATPTGYSTSEASPSTYPTPDTPGVLPSCLNTWLYETGCKDNTDSDCYCKDEQFITHVMGCISAWSGSDSDTGSAASQLIGICAAHVPSNPAIITACPSTVTPAPTPQSSTEVAPVSSAPAVPHTITYYSTQQVTVTSCGPEVTNCPASSTVISQSSYAVSTSVVTPTAPASPPAYSAPSSEVSPVSSAPVSSAPATPHTITYYSTQEITVTSCGPEVTNCPASSTVVSQTSVPVSTSVVVPTAPAYSAPSSTEVSPASSAGVSSAPAYSTVPSSYGSSAPIATAPGASTPAPSCPVTTISYSSPVTIPATYSTGVSSGMPIANSSITTSLVTTVTVPQVQFTTSTVTVNGQTSTVTGLAAGGPSPAPATPTAGPVGGSPTGAPAYPTTLGTGYQPGPTGPSSSSVMPYTGAGVKLSSTSFAGLALGAVAALFVL